MCSLLYFLLSIFAVIISVSSAEGDLPDDNLFQLDNGDPQGSITDFLASDLSNPELIAWNDPGVNTLDQQNTDVDFNLWNSPFNEDGSNTDLLLAADGGCYSTDQVEKRDGKGNPLLCPSNEFRDLKLPTPDILFDKIVPLGQSDDPQNSPAEFLPGDGLLSTEGEGKCPAYHPYFLCCICDPHFQFHLCQDCVLSV